MLGRAKSCRWQVFVRRRPPKQGELRTDVSKATMFQGDRGLRTSILSARRTGCHFLRRAKSNQKARGTPSCDLDSNRRSIRDCCENDRHSSSNRQRRKRQFPGIAGNDLNRCEVPALQHKIRANSKRIVVFFANSRLRVV